MRSTTNNTEKKKTKFTSYASNVDNLNIDNPIKSPSEELYNPNFFFPDLSSANSPDINGMENELISPENCKPEHGLYKTVYARRYREFDSKEADNIVNNFLTFK